MSRRNSAEELQPQQPSLEELLAWLEELEWQQSKQKFFASLVEYSAILVFSLFFHWVQQGKEGWLPFQDISLAIALVSIGFWTYTEYINEKIKEIVAKANRNNSLPESLESSDNIDAVTAFVLESVDDLRYKSTKMTNILVMLGLVSILVSLGIRANKEELSKFIPFLGSTAPLTDLSVLDTIHIIISVMNPFLVGAIFSTMGAERDLANPPTSADGGD